MKKNKISKNWIKKQHKDFYVKKSKIEGYRSRSAFKLIEIDNKFKIFKNRKNFLDLGAAPGGWTQIAVEKMKYGKILSVDKIKMYPIKNSRFILGDFNDQNIRNSIINYFKINIDIIVSDMAENTTGNKNLDSFNTGQLCLNAMEFSKNYLKSEGVFVSKIFMGSIFKEILENAKKIFEFVKVYKPLASRKKSKENYIICKNLK